jgi:hypothetical protein
MREERAEHEQPLKKPTIDVLAKWVIGVTYQSEERGGLSRG